MNISVLILTHNRPKLFKRCLYSVLNNIPKNVDILVNNDSNDIEEIVHPQIKYFYKKSENLSTLYKYLFNKTLSEYVYFLEDDDYIIDNFWDILSNISSNVKYDLYYMNFRRDIDTILSKNMLQFKQEKENNKFQLSQILFKKDKCSDFPDGNYLDNDWKLYQNVLKNSKTTKIIKIPMFIQTTDGKDNISFKEFNSDQRFI